MEKGVVKCFYDAKGFGFITRLNGQEVFVHSSSILGTGNKQLSPGDNVRFEVEKRMRGLKAYRVEKISF